MQRILLLCLLPVVALAAAPGAEGFSRRLSPEDFRAAGLDKLSPAERDRLDALVEARHGSGTRRVEAAEPAPASARGVAAPAASARDTRVVVAPGAKVEYAAIETRLTGRFTGWEPRGVFSLENGQRWREANGTTYVTPPLESPKVRITAGALGAFWMEIEGVRIRVKVVRVDSGR